MRTVIVITDQSDVLDSLHKIVEVFDKGTEVKVKSNQVVNNEQVTRKEEKDNKRSEAARNVWKKRRANKGKSDIERGNIDNTERFDDVDPYDIEDELNQIEREGSI